MYFENYFKPFKSFNTMRAIETFTKFFGLAFLKAYLKELLVSNFQLPSYFDNFSKHYGPNLNNLSNR